MDNSVIAKSGWLYRQTTVLKKWKKSWVELYRDGYLKHYENEHSPNADDVIYMPTECLTIKTSSQIEGVQPPEGLSSQCLFSVVTSTGKNWVFCGETIDDMRAWHLALEQARLLGVPQASTQPPPLPPPYSSMYIPAYANAAYVSPLPPAYSPAGYYGYPVSPYVIGQQPPTTVIYQPDRYHYGGTDLAMGMLAGAAIGSMMWGPHHFGCWW